MLSGTKHLQYLLESGQMQILRVVYSERSERAQEDSRRGIFRNLVSIARLNE